MRKNTAIYIPPQKSLKLKTALPGGKSAIELAAAADEVIEGEMTSFQGELKNHVIAAQRMLAAYDTSEEPSQRLIETIGAIASAAQDNGPALGFPALREVGRLLRKLIEQLNIEIYPSAPIPKKGVDSLLTFLNTIILVLIEGEKAADVELLSKLKDASD